MNKNYKFITLKIINQLIGLLQPILDIEKQNPNKIKKNRRKKNIYL